MGEPDGRLPVRAIDDADLDPGRLASALDRVEAAIARPTVRVWAFSAALALIGLVLDMLLLERRPVGWATPVTVPWPVIAVGFCLAELKVVDVHFRREQHSFSLSEFPAVLGLFLLSPHDYVLAVVLGSAVALAWFRQPPLKLTFNLVNFGLGAIAAQSVFHLLAPQAGQPSPPDWLAAF